MIPPPPSSTLFPYTTLFRSWAECSRVARGRELQSADDERSHARALKERQRHPAPPGGRVDGLETQREVGQEKQRPDAEAQRDKLLRSEAPGKAGACRHGIRGRDQHRYRGGHISVHVVSTQRVPGSRHGVGGAPWSRRLRLAAARCWA